MDLIIFVTIWLYMRTSLYSAAFIMRLSMRWIRFLLMRREHPLSYLVSQVSQLSYTRLAMYWLASCSVVRIFLSSLRWMLLWVSFRRRQVTSSLMRRTRLLTLLQEVLRRQSSSSRLIT